MKTIPIRKITANITDQKLSQDFSIRKIQELFNGKDLIQDTHIHDFFSIIALNRGKGKHVIDFTTYKVGNCSVYFLRPGQVHQLMLDTGCTGFLLQFRKDFYYTNTKSSILLLRRTSKNSFYQFTTASFKKPLSILSNIFQEYTDKKENYSEVIKADLSLFFIELLRQINEDKPNNSRSFNENRLDEFTELLETHIATKKQVSQYAEMLNLSPYQLNSLTKSGLGKKCSEVIDEQIILESKRYLLATSNQVKEIAYNLGYEDVSYFIRFFKKHTSYSPDSFRHNFR